MATGARDIVDFWLGLDEKQYWTADTAFDALVRERFAAALDQARAGTFDRWAGTPEGALGLVILLDQTSRNIHRGTPQAFAADARALSTAKSAVANGYDDNFEARVRRWFYMPYMHSEDLADQEACVALTAKRAKGTLKFAIQHRDIIARFGRFPHRNGILGRETTQEEQAFLDAGGFSG